MRQTILYYALHYQGDYHKVSKAIQRKEPIQAKPYQGSFVTIVDDDYPASLLRLANPPWILFYEGDFSLLRHKMVAVIGAREKSVYGETCTAFLLHHLKSSYGIVSGMAKGIDACAHRYALRMGRPTIGVLGNGLDVFYPKENTTLYDNMKKKGLLVSEYPNGTKPLAHHFPNRNRIIAAMCEHLVVVEAKSRSGTMITVNEALEMGVDVSCFPHDITRDSGKGCHIILSQGGHILYDATSIKEI